MNALPTFGVEANALQADVNSKQVLAAASQVAAATSETNAAASANASAASSNATIWISGTTYAIGDVRFSPVDYQSYRRKTAGAGTTDPNLDFTNWQSISVGVKPMLWVRDEKASSVAGGAITGGDITQVRTLNTVKINSIAGASLSSNVIVLPAGTYSVKVCAPVGSAIPNKTFLYNSTDSTYTINGMNSLSTSLIDGRFTITATKSFTIRHYIASSGGVNDGGAPCNSGQVEVYTEVVIVKEQ